MVSSKPGAQLETLGLRRDSLIQDRYLELLFVHPLSGLPHFIFSMSFLTCKGADLNSHHDSILLLNFFDFYIQSPYLPSQNIFSKVLVPQPVWTYPDAPEEQALEAQTCWPRGSLSPLLQHKQLNLWASPLYAQNLQLPKVLPTNV